MIATLIQQFGPYIVGILGLIGGAFGLYFSGKKTGKAELMTAQAKEKAEEALKEAAESVGKATELTQGVTDVQSDINKLNAGDAASRLRNEWNRDANGSQDKDN